MSDKNKEDLTIKDRVIFLRSIEKLNESEIARVINSEFYNNEKNFNACRSKVRWILDTKKDHSSKQRSAKRYAENKKIEQTPFILSAFNQTTGRIMDIEEYCNHYGLPISNIKDNKLITHTGTPYWNIHWKSSSEIHSDEVTSEMIDEIVKKYAKKADFTVIKRKRSNDITRAIYTDTHIAMCPNPDGNSLYGGLWNKTELLNRMREMAGDIVLNAIKNNSSVLYVDDLGDFMDGWERRTTRREHELPQNMSTKDAFDLGVQFKMELADILVDSGQFSEITFNNVCNDNHAGNFGYIVNSAVKSILDIKYKGLVNVINYEVFIDYYLVGRHAFVLCHGKDEKHMKFGFKPILDDKQMIKIDQFIKDRGLYRKADFFEFSKGDSHQMILDYSTSEDFNYMNYPAFSPASDWVQTNFKKGRSGYVITSFNSELEDIEIYPRTFKWSK